MLKRIVISLLIIFTISQSVFAYSFPQSYWDLQAGYESALDAGDTDGIIKYGTSAIELMKSQPENDNTMGVIGAYSINVADAYEKRADYVKAAELLRDYLKASRYFGWSDGIKISESKIAAYTPELDLYTLTDDSQVYYGARLEPKSGVLSGRVIQGTSDNDSVVLIYQEYGESEYFGWLRKSLAEAGAKRKRVELALNFPNLGAQLSSIIADTSFISGLCDVLSDYSDIPIYLRIGAEFNTWDGYVDAEMYKQAFRKIAIETRRASNNLATVWSISHTSKDGINTDDYYPGDEYVDWVGVSAYAVRHFEGKEWDDNYNEIYFKAGDGAEPNLIMRETIEKYGERKPIMLAECGSAWYTYGSINRESEDWAYENMRRMFSTLMMKYPQIKLAAYFDTYLSGETHMFELRSSQKMLNGFNDITSQPWFIKNGEGSAKSFAKCSDTIIAQDGNIELYAMPYMFGGKPRVDYTVDGKWIDAVSEAPYRCRIDNLSQGTHTLEAVMTVDGKWILSRTYTISVPDTPSEIDGFRDTGALDTRIQYKIKAAADRDIVEGYDGGYFKPYSDVTRAEFAVMVCRAFGYTPEGECSFSDAREHWASAYINACVSRGAISGVGGGLFAPNESITLEQAAKIVTVCAGLANSDTEYPDGFMAAGVAYALFDDVSASPKEPISRADAAVLLVNLP